MWMRKGEEGSAGKEGGRGKERTMRERGEGVGKHERKQGNALLNAKSV